jgi:glutathione S-transferase
MRGPRYLRCPDEPESSTMLKILGRATSINVRKVLWCCAELDLPIEHEPWGDAGLELRSAAFTALNPNAKVPVLQDGDFTMWESNAICRYLAAREGRDDLLPSTSTERARVEQWMDWQTTDLNTAWRYAFLSLVRNSPAYRDPAAVATSVVEWNRHMRMLDEQLTRTGAYVTGHSFTLADLVLGVSTYRWVGSPIERVDLPAVSVWFERLRERPAFVRQTWGDTP